MKCAHCDVSYPPELLSPLFIAEHGRGEYTKPICAICALELTNEAHGPALARTEFDGKIAESMRQAALAWRRRRNLR